MRKFVLAAAVVLGSGAWSPGVQAQTAAGDAPVPQRPRVVHRPRPAAPPAVAEAGVDGEAPPTSAYTGGANVPLSQRASNIGPGTTRSEVAPRLPNPDAASSTPEGLLAAAQRALSRGQTGAAQQALEMAETRVLSRTTEPSAAGTPSAAAMVQNIGAARRALGAGDRNGAQAAISAALSSPVPPPGPAVTTTTVYPGSPGYVPGYAPGYAPGPAYGVVPPAPPRGY